jgi:hypothetical protein
MNGRRQCSGRTDRKSSKTWATNSQEALILDFLLSRYPLVERPIAPPKRTKLERQVRATAAQIERAQSAGAVPARRDPTDQLPAHPKLFAEVR